MLEREPSTQTVMFLLTDACNLHCTYCYEDTICCDANGHKRKNSSSRSPSRMGPDLIKRLISKHMDQKKFDAVSFDFFGGEPLLEFETVKNVVEWFHHCEWHKKHQFTISTNGTLLTNEIKEWLIKWRDCVIPLLSLDGTREMHNKNRCNSYDDVAKHFSFFRENWPEESVRMTICPSNINHVADGMMHMHSLGFNAEASIQFEDVWGDIDSELDYARSYATNLARLVDFYADHNEFDTPFMLDKNLGTLTQNSEIEEKFCGAGKYMVCYTPDGKAYPCQRFIPLSSSMPTVNPYSQIQPHQRRMQACDECEIRPICPTCEGANWEINGNIAQRTNFHCTFMKLQALASAKLYLRKLDHSIVINSNGKEFDNDTKANLLGIYKFMKSQSYRDIEHII